MQKAGTVDDAQKIRQAMLGLEWQAPERKIKMLPTQGYNVYVPVTVYYESTVGADKNDLLSYVTHTDDLQQNWVTYVVKEYDTIDEIRARRGY
jgi:hypothetical protein